MTTPLAFRDYGFTYASGDSAAVSRVNLEFRAGTVTSVIAGQGEGKTTLLRAAAGLLGEIYHGETTGSLVASPGTSAFFDGYVQVTLAVETVREELGLPLYAAGVPRAERDVRVVSVARELRIESLLDRQVTELSGGEEKLVGIAAALAPEAPVYILDEPFEQLDVTHISAVIRAVKNRARAGKLVLVATASLDIALNIADAAVVGSAGRWTMTEQPTYAMVAGVSKVGLSPVGAFLERHHTSSQGVRRFRDAVQSVR